MVRQRCRDGFLPTHGHAGAENRNGDEVILVIELFLRLFSRTRNNNNALLILWRNALHRDMSNIFSGLTSGEKMLAY